jgi:uncharacterized protein (UPF0333 family)
MNRRGQAATEYMLLLCTVTLVATLTASFVARYGRDLVDRMAERLLDAAIELASPV